MNSIELGPTILGAMAWGCGMSMIMFGTMAAKEGWHGPSVSFMSAPRILGKIGLFLSMFVCAGGAGWWALLIAPAGGMFFGASLTAVLREQTLGASFTLGVLANVIGGVWMAALWF